MPVLARASFRLKAAPRTQRTPRVRLVDPTRGEIISYNNELQQAPVSNPEWKDILTKIPKLVVTSVPTANSTPSINDELVNLLWCSSVLWWVVGWGVVVLVEEGNRLRIFKVSHGFVNAFGIML